MVFQMNTYELRAELLRKSDSSVLHIKEGFLMKKMIVVSLLLILSAVSGCSSGKQDKEISIESELGSLNDLEESDFNSELQNISEGNEPKIEKPEDIFAEIGLTILLPENTNWINNTEYTLIDENNLEICYYDDISGMDCKLSATRNSTLNLTVDRYENALEETWQGETPAGDIVFVKVQHSEDGKKVLATWEYGEYKFAIQGNADDITDTSSISKTALYIISNLE